jgi:hypothetical protein
MLASLVTFILDTLLSLLPGLSGRFPLKAVKVMHTVALRTEATITGGETPSNLGQVFKV